MLVKLQNGRLKLTRDLSKYHTLYAKVNGKLTQQVRYLPEPSLQELGDCEWFRETALAMADL